MFLIQILATSFGCGIDSSDNCQTAFPLFVSCFAKSQSNYDLFCSRLAKLKEAIKTCTSCSVTSSMDRVISYQEPTFDDIKSAQNPYDDDPCQERMCAYKPPFGLAQIVPKSVDLREENLITPAKDQKNCGMCWSFAAIGILENAILNDYANLNQFWKDQVQNKLDLSEQFLASNAYGINDYCKGGNAASAITYLHQHADENLQSVELTSNYQYDFAALADDHKNQKLQPLKIQPENWLHPFRTQLDEDGESTPIVEIVRSQKTKFTPEQRQLIRTFIARGIAVTGGIYMNDSEVLMYYNGTGFVKEKCWEYRGTNHAINIVGYGRKNGVDVWVVKNSWGPTWGANGFFYVPVGDDDMCIEHRAWAIVPKSYNVQSGLRKLLGDHSRRSLLTDLDGDDNGMMTNGGDFIDQVGWPVIVGAVAAVVVVVGAVVIGILMCRRKNSEVKKTDSVKLLDRAGQM